MLSHSWWKRCLCRQISQYMRAGLLQVTINSVCTRRKDPSFPKGKWLQLEARFRMRFELEDRNLPRLTIATFFWKVVDLLCTALSNAAFSRIFFVGESVEPYLTVLLLRICRVSLRWAVNASNWLHMVHKMSRHKSCPCTAFREGVNPLPSTQLGRSIVLQKSQVTSFLHHVRSDWKKLFHFDTNAKRWNKPGVLEGGIQWPSAMHSGWLFPLVCVSF